jgi:LysR family transcriptional activator of nhaA
MKTNRPINLKHLRYFAEVARRGSVTQAARALFVTPQTVSGQVQELERAVGQPLFERIGRRFVLTAAGTTALEYADAIFALNDELGAVLRGAAQPKSVVLKVGVTDSVPKLLTTTLLDALVTKHRDSLVLDCRESSYAELLGQVGAGELDLVLADAPVPASLARSLHTKIVADAGVSFVAAPALAARLSGGFPKNLDGAPFLYGSPPGSLLDQTLEAWFARHDVRPRVVGHIDDSALLKGFAQTGFGVIAVSTSIERQVARQYRLKRIGRTEEIRQQVFLIRARARRVHPLVAEVEAAQ